MASVGGGVYRSSFELAQPLASDLPEGYYRPFIFVAWSGARWQTPLAGAKATFNGTFDSPPGQALGPMFRVGNPAAPRLPIMLLAGSIHSGVRGVEDPAQAYLTAQRIAQGASRIVLPRTNDAGQPQPYRIEPVLPAVSHGDRGLDRAPFVTFRLPSGQVTATVQGPRGTATLGPAPFVQTRSSTPATTGAQLLDNGGGNLTDPIELITRSPAFQYAFPAAGQYTIRVQGSVQDQSGFTWSMDGTFQVQVADQLDLKPPVPPGLPLKVGEKLPIALQVNPSLPASVEVEVKFAPNSDASRIVTRTFVGTANRYGYFFGGETFAFDTPGEYAVEFRAAYQQGDDAWAGVLAWSSVVAEQNPSIIVHGRRGIDNLPPPQLDRERFTRRSTGSDAKRDSNHVNFPYRSGDVLLQPDDDAAQVHASFEDPTGALRSFFTAHPVPNAGIDARDQGRTLAQRFDAGEAPFLSKSTSGIDPVLDPSHTDLRAYYYAAVDRPGERVRAGATEDDTNSYYWRFIEQYAAQPGLGTEGDRPADVKFQYVGGVVRTPQKNHYARYASLWVELPDNDPIGSRVVAPFSERLMRIEDKDISLFAVLTLVKPGTVLEVGNRFGLAGQVGPTVAATVHIELKAPDGSVRSWDTATNEIGAFFIPDATGALNAPGIYQVSVSVKSGSVTGRLFDKDSFSLPVVPKGAKAPVTNLPASGIVSGLQVNVAVTAPSGTLVGSLITIPGWSLEDGTVRAGGGPVVLKLDTVELQKEYPLVDTRLPHADEPGLADAFVWVITTGSGADLQARRIVLFGPQLWNP